MSSPTSPPSSTATGATSTRCAHAGSPSDWAGQAWEVVHEAYVAAFAMTRLGATASGVDAPSATSSRPTRTSAPACTARATRSAPRSTSRPSSSPLLGRRAARRHDLHRRAGIYTPTRRDPARGRRPGRPRRPGHAVDAPAPVRVIASARRASLVHPAHLLAAAARRHRAPAAAAARVEEDPPAGAAGQRCRRATRAGSASSATASAATAKRTRRGSSSRQSRPKLPSSRGTSVPAATACA